MKNMHEHPQRTGWFQSKPTTWILLGFIAIGAFFSSPNIQLTSWDFYHMSSFSCVR